MHMEHTLQALTQAWYSMHSVGVHEYVTSAGAEAAEATRLALPAAASVILTDLHLKEKSAL